MNATRKMTTPPTVAQITARAHQLWEQDGCQPSRDWDYWLQAESELLADFLPAKEAKMATLMILKSKPRQQPSGRSGARRRNRKVSPGRAAGWERFSN